MGCRNVLMCPPTHYEIAYSINPFMRAGTDVNGKRAHDQWLALRETLETSGLTVHTIPAVAGLPDMSFAADCGFVYGKRFLPSCFHHPERRGEVEHYVRWMEGHSYEILPGPSGISFEGMADIIRWQDQIIVGHSVRSTRDSADVVRRAFPGLNIVCRLDLACERFYHTALAITFVDAHRVLYYPPAFTEASRLTIERCFDEAVAVGEEDAVEHFVCNMVTVGSTMLMAGCSKGLEQRINEWGYEVARLDMSEFKKSGGSVRCLVLDLD